MFANALQPFISDFHKMELGEQPLVQTASAIFRELCYNYRDSLVAGILVAGWDKKSGGNYGYCLVCNGNN